MQPQTRNHLAFLDRALLNLLEERARLLADEALEVPANLEDLLLRASGDFAPHALSGVFEAIQAGCHANSGGAR